MGTIVSHPIPEPSVYCCCRSRGGGDGGVGVQLNPGPAGHVAHEVRRHEDLLLANGLEWLTVNETGLLGGRDGQLVLESQLVLNEFWAGSRK